MASIDDIYKAWRQSLKTPDDSIFYYHPDLERVILGLAIYAISSPRLIQKIKGHEEVKLLNIYVKDLVTAWIDENDEAFETMFSLTMAVAEGFMQALIALGRENRAAEKNIRKLACFYACTVACGGDMNPTLAESLLDDISTDGENIYSDKIKKFGTDVLGLIQLYGIDIHPSQLNKLNGW